MTWIRRPGRRGVRIWKSDDDRYTCQATRWTKERGRDRKWLVEVIDSNKAAYTPGVKHYAHEYAHGEADILPTADALLAELRRRQIPSATS
jgi:hypothetical protein